MNIRILVFDPEYSELTAQNLKNALGCEADFASNLEEATQLFESEEFDVLIVEPFRTEYQAMQGESGEDVKDFIQSVTVENPDMHIMVISVQTKEILESLQGLIAAKDYDVYFDKPIDMVDEPVAKILEWFG